LYDLHYGDGSSTVGFFAQDNLTISHDAIKGFRFRCGAAGIMGLGRGKTSLTVQAYDRYAIRRRVRVLPPGVVIGDDGPPGLGPRPTRG
jgi:hypothetical protein